MEKDLKEMSLMLRASQAENERLRVELQLMADRSSRFSTPQGTRVGSGSKEDGSADRQGKLPERRQERNEDGPAGQQEKSKPRSKEDGPERRQDRSEDGPERQQADDASEVSAPGRAMDVILKLLEGTQSMQRQLMNGKDEEREKEGSAEFVRHATQPHPAQRIYMPAGRIASLCPYLQHLPPATAPLSVAEHGLAWLLGQRSALLLSGSEKLLCFLSGSGKYMSSKSLHKEV